jgi:ectoine hydroxylase-related dioxygenase (phytanoyl-CoA dioxygenase family)
MREAISQIIARDPANEDHSWQGDFMDAGELSQMTLKAYHDLQYHDARFTRAITHPRLVSVLQALIGPDVVLHHSKMLVKPPETGAPFPMHQDYPYFPHTDHTVLAALVHLDDTAEENGCLHVIPGSHANGPLKHAGSYHLAHEYSLDHGTPIPATAGDVLFFNYLTIHGSGVNRSDRPRRAVLFQYRAASDRPSEITHINWGAGLVVAGCDDYRRHPHGFSVDAA